MLGDQRKLQTAELNVIQMCRGHITSADTNPWPQFTSHSKPQLLTWFQVNLCYSLDLEYPQGCSIEKLWNLWGRGPSERSLGHREHILGKYSAILGSSGQEQFCSLIMLDVLCCLTAGLRTMRPTDHGLRPPKLWAKISFERLNISAIWLWFQKATLTLTPYFVVTHKRLPFLYHLALQANQDFVRAKYSLCLS